MQARAVEAEERAMADEAARTQGLLAGGFVSPNEAEQKTAKSNAGEAQVSSTQADLAAKVLAVDDCILRAPFDGEVATRSFDPGAFVRPGMSIISVIDRGTVRFVADAPEIDFEVVGENTKVRIHSLAIGRDFVGVIARRAPSADAATRTVHFEVDLSDPRREIPVSTTAEVHIDVGEPKPATSIAVSSASVRGEKVSVFTVEGDVARQKIFPLIGERGGLLFVPTALKAGSPVVSEGRELLQDGDRVAAKEAKP
jgi:RND family efflux transporter MFP subunit